MSRASHVYFIKPVGMNGPIKIGCSNIPEKRLFALSTWSPFPLEIVVKIPGNFRLEKNIHDCFADLHSHREWFHPGKKLLDAIDLIKSGVQISQAINLNNRIGMPVIKRGGSCWSDVTRQKMGVLHRVRQALLKIGVDNHYMAPDFICDLMSISEQRLLTSEELEIIKTFSKNPHQYADECLKRYLPWKARFSSAASNPSEAT